MTNLRATEISPMDLRASLGELLDRVRLRHDSFIVTRRGEPMAALVPVERLALMEELARKYSRLMSRLQEEHVERSGASGEELEKVAIEAVARVRSRRRGG